MAANVDKGIYQAPAGISGIEGLADQMTDEIEVEIVDEEGDDALNAQAVAAALTSKAQRESVHTANLAETMDEQSLTQLFSELNDLYDIDLRSRKDWEQTYRKGLELLGLKDEERTEPWKGACGVVHPMLAEAVVRFQSEAITETFPARGPVRTKILGRTNPAKEKAAERVREDMNWRLTEEMPEYRTEHERMLFNLPVAGSAFKKVYFDTTLKRQMSRFVPAEDFVISYGASDLVTAERYSVRIRYTEAEIKAAIAAGFYRDIDFGTPGRRKDEIQEAKDKQTGMRSLEDDRYEFVEMHVDIYDYGLGVAEGERTLCRPYVVTINRENDTIMSIYRNWDEKDAKFIKKQHFVHYPYVPGFGFYGFGLIHLVGGYAKAATSLTRQLVDAGTLSNLPGGLKSKSLRVRGDDTPIAPGEWRDAEVVGAALKDGLFPMPYGEPSTVLAALLERIVEDGQRMASTADTKLVDLTGNTPVGTTLAVLERTLKVMSAVQARVHAALSIEFKLLKALVRETAPAEYSYEPIDETRAAKKADYDIVEIIPVSDPNASTLAQRVVTQQAVIQMAEKAPQIYDLPQVHGDMLRIVGVRDPERLIPQLQQGKPKDPVSENMAILMGKPVKVYAYQDHEAHIAVHTMAMQDPKIAMLIGQNPQAQALIAAGHAHLAEHVAFAYRSRIEQAMGAQLPDPNDGDIPPEIEYKLSGVIAQAASKVLQQSQAEAAQQAAQVAAADPVLQMQAKELEIKEGELEEKKREHDDKMDVEWAKLGVTKELKDKDTDTKAMIAGAQIASDGIDKIQERTHKAEQGERERSVKGLIAGAQLTARASQGEGQGEGSDKKPAAKTASKSKAKPK